MWNDLDMSQRAEIISLAVKSGIRDMKSIRDLYNSSTPTPHRYDREGSLYGEGGKKTNSDELNKIAEAQSFINDYIHSPGFAKRLELFNSDYKIAPDFKVNPQVNIVDNKDSYAEPYFGDKGRIFLNPLDEAPDTEIAKTLGISKAEMYDELGATGFPKGWVASHEMAHVLDAQLTNDLNFKRNSLPAGVRPKRLPYAEYHSYRYPQLKPSKEVNTHDADPAESYADLIAFRKYLKDNNIYDSNDIQDFNKDHLLKIKKIAGEKDDFIRLLHNFNDDEVINIMNTVAQAPQNTNSVSPIFSYNTMLSNGGRLFAKGGNKETPINYTQGHYYRKKEKNKQINKIVQNNWQNIW